MGGGGEEVGMAKKKELDAPGLEKRGIEARPRTQRHLLATVATGTRATLLYTLVYSIMPTPRSPALPRYQLRSMRRQTLPVSSSNRLVRTGRPKGQTPRESVLPGTRGKREREKGKRERA